MQANEKPVDGIWAFAAHVFDKIPSGSLIGFLLAGAVVVGLYKGAPILLRVLMSNTDALTSSASAFESMEAHLTAALSALKDSMNKGTAQIRVFNTRLVELEKRVERALTNDKSDD